MNRSKGEFNYYEDQDLQILELPYGNGKVSMYIFLSSDIKKFYEKLTVENLNTWLSKMSKANVVVSLPKFKLEYEKELKEILKDMGLGIAFSDEVNFSNMISSRSVGLSIDKVLHKTFLEVNEEGTEAAAATEVLIIGIPHKFIVDKPFFFIIKDKQNGTILFMGSIVEPTE